jgi:hypothetical protein
MTYSLKKKKAERQTFVTRWIRLREAVSAANVDGMGNES